MWVVGGLQMPTGDTGELHSPVPLPLRPLGLPRPPRPASLGDLLFL